MRQTSSFLAKLLPAPSHMKIVLAFLTVLKSRDGHLRNLIKEPQKKLLDEMRLNAPNLKLFVKTAAGTLPDEERLDVFDCFEVSRWP